MDKYRLPTVIELFIALCTNLLAGLKKLGEELKITQVTAADFEKQLDALAANQSNYAAARSAKKSAADATQPTDQAVYDFLMTARNAFIKSFGVRWNTQWAQAGWTDHSTAIPKKLEAARSRVKAVSAFLTKNPSYEVPPLNVTSKEADNVYNASVLADTAVSSATTAQTTTKDLRTGADAAMRTSARMLINVLSGVLGNDDPRWQEFGLQMPATPTTPGQPVNVTAQMDASGAVRVSCDATPLAQRYRWRTLIVGSQTQYRLAASGVDPTALIKDVTPGDTLRIVAQAVNGGSQGKASEPIEFTVPLPVVASAIPEPIKAVEPALVLDEAVIAPATGHANGNGYRERAQATNGAR